ncbi:OLC1v1005083C1 [Oldenlandia corymbosa var. corymbosa]|uniref:OLC1v1005083C1 n=1 Tax=Oldenlandia corymbosa var. corymbosa TaxID=529605 RepID=A0AAV1DDV1_OLDCO|nr:OLC1v1005083C1 [Oldenlandia corymbosa var. corymbosa]
MAGRKKKAKDRKKKPGGNRSCDSQISPGGKPELPENVIFIILSWLPAKSLMRFKLVSKPWLALIRDPYFAETHLANSRTETRQPFSSYILFYVIGRWAMFPANPDAVFSTQLPMHRFTDHDEHGIIIDEAEPCSNIVNGLILLWSPSSYQLRLLNVTTKENIGLPKTRRSISSCHCSGPSNNFLGFDPINKVYKVVHSCGQDKCFVMTLSFGNMMRWREIVSTYPQYDLVYRKNICVDGSIFWEGFEFCYESGDEGKRALQYFDVSEESFKLVPVSNGFFHGDGNAHHPDIFLSQNRKFDYYDQLMTEVGGRFTLAKFIHHPHPSQIKLWTLMNKHDPFWIQSYIELPEQVFYRGIDIVGSTNTEEGVIYVSVFAWKVLVTHKRVSTETSDAALIFCDPGKKKNKEKKENKYEIKQLQFEDKSSPVHALVPVLSTVASSHHIENILPLSPPKIPIYKVV